MEKKTGTPTVVSMILITLSMLLCICHAQKRQTYIVQVKKHEGVSSFDDHAQLYTSSLASVSTSSQMMYMYMHTIIGFSASLTNQEAEAMSARDEILSVRLQTTYQLHTTRVPLFLGLEQYQDKLPNVEKVSNIIIGVLDTGIWPKSMSFNDRGYSPVSETRFKGTCEGNICNKKLVGAMHFSKAYEKALLEQNRTMEDTGEDRSPVDIDGHGTHTASTAGGSAVPGASLYGYANGTAQGMAAQARLAAYKCCWKLGCFGADILAAMDRAIEDNVDVLSLSLGGIPVDYYSDIIAIGAFAAVKKGIVVSCSAGNSGPKPYSVGNVAPWLLTVGAGSLDRDFPAYVKLGNGETYYGVSLYNGPLLGAGKMYPIVYGGDAAIINKTAGALCANNTLIPEKVKGKIVLCDRGENPRVEKGLVVQAAGGLGMILANTAENGNELVADAHLLPALAVNYDTRNIILDYLSSAANNAKANISFGGTKLGVQPSPVVAAFSARGPNQITPEILKPDLIAPGLNILAAWTEREGPTGLAFDKRVVDFNIISGTSMSCPVVSGLAALLKAAHPDWSPAAIRSALMTTAYSTYKNKNGSTLLDAATGKQSNPFGYGAGHVHPISALDPGLVYDLCPLDYLNFLCASNYNSTMIEMLVRETNFTCDKNKTYSVNDLNYPSFAVPVRVDPKGGFTVLKYKRTLTNVGQPGLTYTYRVSITSPSPSVKISVFPRTLIFNRLNEKKSYTVKFKVAMNMQANTSLFGRIEWSDCDGKYVVGSSVAISWTHGK